MGSVAARRIPIYRLLLPVLLWAAACQCCSVVYYFHIPKTGGGAMANTLKRASNKKIFGYTFHKRTLRHHKGVSAATLARNQRPRQCVPRHPSRQHAKVPLTAGYYDFWNDKEMDVERYVDRVTSDISRLCTGETMFISQHHNTPGLHAMSRDVLPMWRRAASERGCKFFGFTLVRDPLERAISDFYFSNHKPEGLAVALEIPQYDNGITRYTLNNHYNNGYQEVNIPQHQVSRQHADMAFAAIGALDLVAEMRCVPVVARHLARLTGMPLAVGVGTASSGAARVREVPVAVVKGLKEQLDQDNYLFKELEMLPTFLNCSHQRQTWRYAEVSKSVEVAFVQKERIAQSGFP